MRNSQEEKHLTKASEKQDGVKNRPELETLTKWLLQPPLILIG